MKTAPFLPNEPPLSQDQHFQLPEVSITNSLPSHCPLAHPLPSPIKTLACEGSWLLNYLSSNESPSQVYTAVELPHLSFLFTKGPRNPPLPSKLWSQKAKEPRKAPGKKCLSVESLTTLKRLLRSSLGKTEPKGTRQGPSDKSKEKDNREALIDVKNLLTIPKWNCESLGNISCIKRLMRALGKSKRSWRH